MVKTSLWRALLRDLRRVFPVKGKVIVRRCPLKKFAGRTRFDGCSTFRIWVNSTHPESCQIDTLLHEWAHVCAIEQAYEHEWPWGAIYTRIYDTWVRGHLDPPRKKT